MLFNSFEYAVFLPLVLVLYWSLPRRPQNILLLISSYLFYGFWDWRFLGLIAFSTAVDYIAGLGIDRAQRRNLAGSAKAWLVLSIVTNLGILGFFKYFDFFASSLTRLVAPLSIEPDYVFLNIILPVGISFYTFQSLSYTIDVYRGRVRPCRDLGMFALYVAFFPQLVAGPIERAQNLLPQFSGERRFRWQRFRDGMLLILIGLFKKVYVADSIAPYVDRVFQQSEYTGLEVLVASWLFAFQIYADFSGYSDVARGSAKCLGIDLMLNFRFPYLASNPKEFWERWHISLSTWLRDYLYIPLGGNRRGEGRTYRNLLITMLLGGLWHGAAWNFVLWGAYQGILLCIHRYIVSWRGRSAAPTKGFSTGRLAAIALFFQLTCYGWILFRSTSLVQIGHMTRSLFHGPWTVDPAYVKALLLFGGALVVFEAVHTRLWASMPFRPATARYGLSMLYAVISYLFIFNGGSSHSFIYFQF